MDRKDAEAVWLRAMEDIRFTGYIPHQPTPKQRAFLVMPHREVLFGGAAGGGKQVKTTQIMQYWGRSGGDCDTLVPMIDIADAIVVGDYLIGSDGKPKRVLSKSIPEYREFYRVSFDDGTSLDVSGDHLWTVFDLSKRGPGQTSRGWYSRTLTTEKILSEDLKYRTQNRFAIPLISGPVDGPAPEKPPVPPYTLGYWFGNGCKQASTLTCHTDDVESILSNIEPEVGRKEFRVYDETAKRAKILISGWNQTLRSAAWPCELVGPESKQFYVFMKDRMPREWRFWSVEDRKSLLAGLLDSDGHATTRGDIEFDNTCASLSFLVFELLQSLGMKPAYPRRREGRANELPSYRVSCTPTMQVFRLERKAERLSFKERQLKQSRRYIVSIEPTGIQEGVCFAVDSDDHLYVAGRNYIVTHNSDALLMAALQYVDCSEYNAIMFRKTFSDLSLPGALIPRSHEWLANSDAKWNQTRHEWTFPSGAKLAFGYLEHEVDKYRYQGAEFNCVPRGQRVLMSGGGWLEIERIRVGDVVRTLRGDCPVTRTWRVGVGPVSRMETRHGSARISSNHRFLRSSGEWVSHRELQSTGYHSFCNTCEESLERRSGLSKPFLYSLMGLLPSSLLDRRNALGMGLLGFFSYLTGGRSGFGLSAGGHEVSRPHDSGFVQTVLSVPSLQSAVRGLSSGGVSCARVSSSHQGFPSDYRSVCHSCGEPLLPAIEGVLSDTQQQVGVEVCSQVDLHSDDLSHTQGYNHLLYAHPYTTEFRWTDEDVLPVLANMVQEDEEELFDLTVSSESHYIVEPGIPVQNCICFDELTQFPEDDYLYLHSRLRRLADSKIPLRIRCATNPGGTGHKWVKDRYAIGKVQTGDRIRYIGTNRERPYIPAFVKDNPYLSRDEYEDVLTNLDPVTREQLLRGDWGVSAEGRFRKAWVNYFSTRGVHYILGTDGQGEAVHGKDVELMMVVDPAASVRSGPGDKSIWRKNQSQTVIGMFARTLDHNHLLWIDCDFGSWEIPDVLDNIVAMHRRWEPEQICIEASGLGIGVVTMLEQAGLPIKRLSPKSQDKLVRATDACNRMERGLVWLPQTAQWLDAVETELFTWTGHPDEPDDMVDVLAYAAKEVSTRAMDQAELLRSSVAYNVPHSVGGHDSSGEYQAHYFHGME